MRYYFLFLDAVSSFAGRRGKLHVALAVGLGLVSAVLVSAMASLVEESFALADVPPWLDVVIVTGGGWLVTTLCLLQPPSIASAIRRACAFAIAEWVVFVVGNEALLVSKLGSSHVSVPRALATSIAFSIVVAAGPAVPLWWLRRTLNRVSGALSTPGHPA